MRVLVCGGRTTSDQARVFEVLDRILVEVRGIELLIHGGAAGADRIAGDWARARDIDCEVFVAEWSKYGGHAGPIRNSQMLRIAQPQLVVAFPGGAGTLDMVTKARAAGVEVREVER